MSLSIKKEYDVVVVGAGPGGSVAARFAAESGASVLFLERDRETGIPVRCAEGVSSPGLDQFIDIDERWIANEIYSARFITPDGNTLDMKSHVKGYILERRIFDTALCDLASQKGATMLTRANVTHAKRTPDGLVEVAYTHIGTPKTVKCKIIIGADGIESRVGRWFGIKTNLSLTDVSSAIQYTINNIEIDPHRLEFHFGTNIAPGGYLWIFPKSANTANIGIGITGNFASEKPAKAYLDEFISKRFENPSINYTVFAGIPVARTLNEIVADNVMLVGDAARQVNPITGGGIKQAMIAGRLAGKLAGEAVKTGNYSTKFLSKYPSEWDKILGSKHSFIHAMKERVIYASDERLNKISRACAHIPPEKMTTLELFKQVVKGDPKLVLDMSKAFLADKFTT
ncbi:MAG: NAD(P)/FAD-dependent oxidoreductase [Candidatus Cloacimonadia bacterium]